MGTLRLFFRLMLAVAGLIVVFLVVGSLIPREFQFETRIKIEKPAAQIFPLVNDLRQWQLWTHFNPQSNTNLDLNYGATTAGPDASMTWIERRGKGKLWIETSQANNHVAYAVEFANFPRMKSNIQFEETNGQTEVVWDSSGSLPFGPFYGWFGMYFSEALRRDYDANLQRLKELVEAEPTADNSPNETEDNSATVPPIK